MSWPSAATAGSVLPTISSRNLRGKLLEKRKPRESEVFCEIKTKINARAREFQDTDSKIKYAIIPLLAHRFGSSIRGKKVAKPREMKGTKSAATAHRGANRETNQRALAKPNPQQIGNRRGTGERLKAMRPIQ